MFDETYCNQVNCENRCGRKMSDHVKIMLDFFPWRSISYARFCDDDGNLVKDKKEFQQQRRGD